MARGNNKNQEQAEKHTGAPESMRLDKYLKVSRIIKRRTVAGEACDGGRVLINGKEGKPGAQVKVGDRLEVRFGARTTIYEVVTLSEHVLKSDANGMYRVIGGDAAEQ